MACGHSGVQHVLNWWVTWRVSCKRQELLILRALRLLIFLGFCVVFFVWCVFVDKWQIAVESLWKLGFLRQIKLKKTEGAMKNGQSRETGNIGYTRYWTKTHQTKNTTQKLKKMSSHLSGSLPCFFIRARETAAHINWSLVACYKTNEYNTCFTE
jgi:Tfp pilus assembly protein PilN